jgi:hypothetical protein
MTGEMQPTESATSEVSSATSPQYDEKGNQIKPKVFAQRKPYVVEVTHLGEDSVHIRYADGEAAAMSRAVFHERFELVVQ